MDAQPPLAGTILPTGAEAPDTMRDDNETENATAKGRPAAAGSTARRDWGDGVLHVWAPVIEVHDPDDPEVAEEALLRIRAGQVVIEVPRPACRCGGQSGPRAKG